MNSDIALCSFKVVWCLREWGLWDGAVAFRPNLCDLSSLTENLPGAEERDKRETAEREKQLLEERCTRLRRQLNLLEIYCKESMIQMKEELRRREKHEKEQDERIRRLEVSLAWDRAGSAEQSPETPEREG